MHLYKVSAKQQAIDSTLVDDTSITSIITPFKKELESKMNTVLAYSPTNLSKARNKPETAIGNFMADLCFTRGNAVFTKKQVKILILYC